ncbi:Ribokinase-like protein [Xylariomycetidae sp. FL2044]|nr:Ribokinase-like protein [Xylariomycetidae sp. FL2044]
MEETHTPAAPAFVSLGMVLRDELHLPGGKVLHHVIGGSGAYSTLGARLVTRPEDAHEIGCFILAGHDFPAEVVERFRDWGLTMEMSVDERRESTRGLLEYHDEAFGRKSFRYLTAPLQPSARDLPATFVASLSFHMLLPPEKVPTEIHELLARRTHTLGDDEARRRPLVVWEPHPGLCTEEHLDAHLRACRSTDVLSPNHLELLALFGEPATTELDAKLLETLCARILTSAASSSSSSSALQAVVIRAGEHGCLVAQTDRMTWLPPFFQDSSRVVDATGGGNTFLGAFAVALARSGDLVEAAIQANVAASFAIEQIGLPSRASLDGSGEVWNGARVCDRLREYRGRLE